MVDDTKTDDTKTDDTKPETYTAEQFNAMVAQRDAVIGKNQELLGEKKKAQGDKLVADTAAQAAKDAAAQKKGDFEQLFTSSKQQVNDLQTKLDNLTGNIAVERSKSAALKIAGKLADGDNVELLSSFIAPRLKYADGGVKVLNATGELTVSTLDQLQTEFQNDTRFKSLLRGNQASGSGANGGKSTGGASNTMTRADFDALTPAKKREYAIKPGNAVVD